MDGNINEAKRRCKRGTSVLSLRTCNFKGEINYKNKSVVVV